MSRPDLAILDSIDRAETMTWLLLGYIESSCNKEELITVINGLELLQEQIGEIYRSACHYELKSEVAS